MQGFVGSPATRPGSLGNVARGKTHESGVGLLGQTEILQRTQLSDAAVDCGHGAYAAADSDLSRPAVRPMRCPPDLWHTRRTRSTPAAGEIRYSCRVSAKQAASPIAFHKPSRRCLCPIERHTHVSVRALGSKPQSLGPLSLILLLQPSTSNDEGPQNPEPRVDLPG